MARIIKTIEIEGQPAIALFDTGAVHTYVFEDLIKHAPRRAVAEPFRVALAGDHFEVREFCLMQGRIEGLPFDTKAIPLSIMGKANGKELDVIIGALTMGEWEIGLDPKTGALDLESLRRREFTEF
jgi:hypothetical protein